MNDNVNIMQYNVIYLYFSVDSTYLSKCGAGCVVLYMENKMKTKKIDRVGHKDCSRTQHKQNLVSTSQVICIFF